MFWCGSHANLLLTLYQGWIQSTLVNRRPEICLAVATALSAMRQVRHPYILLGIYSYIILSALQVVRGSLRLNYTLPSSMLRRTLLRTSKGSTPNSFIISTMRFRFVEGFYTGEAVLTHWFRLSLNLDPYQLHQPKSRIYFLVLSLRIVSPFPLYPCLLCHHQSLPSPQNALTTKRSYHHRFRQKNLLPLESVPLTIHFMKIWPS